MPDDKITVAVVMPCRNEAEHIEQSVNSILNQDVEGIDLEVLIADGGSSDGTREILDRLAVSDPRVRVFHNPGGYVSSGLNLVIAAARSEIVIRMDAHTEYARDYIRQCVDTLLRTGADNVGGPARTKADTLMQQAIAAAYHSPFACGGARFHNVSYEGHVDTVTYGCWLKSTLERIGPFDEALIRNQDDELNLRIVRRGGKIWQTPKIVSWYRPRGALSGLFRQYFQYGFWKVAVIRKHRLPASWRHLLPGAFVIAVILLAIASTPLLFNPGHAAARLALSLELTALLTYAAASVAASAMLLPRYGLRVAALAPLVFATYHVSYGTGFLAGLWRFGRNRMPGIPESELFTGVTR